MQFNPDRGLTDNGQAATKYSSKQNPLFTSREGIYRLLIVNNKTKTPYISHTLVYPDTIGHICFTNEEKRTYRFMQFGSDCGFATCRVGATESKNRKTDIKKTISRPKNSYNFKQLEATMEKQNTNMTTIRPNKGTNHTKLAKTRKTSRTLSQTDTEKHTEKTITQNSSKDNKTVTQRLLTPTLSNWITTGLKPTNLSLAGTNKTYYTRPKLALKTNQITYLASTNVQTRKINNQTNPKTKPQTHFKYTYTQLSQTTHINHTSPPVNSNNPIKMPTSSGANKRARAEDSESNVAKKKACLLYTSPSPRDRQKSRMPSSA